MGSDIVLPISCYQFLVCSNEIHQALHKKMQLLNQRINGLLVSCLFKKKGRKKKVQDKKFPADSIRPGKHKYLQILVQIHCKTVIPDCPGCIHVCILDKMQNVLVAVAFFPHINFVI